MTHPAPPRPPKPATGRHLRCDECGTPILRVSRRGIIIEAWHHSQKHTSVIPLAELQALIAAANTSADE